MALIKRSSSTSSFNRNMSHYTKILLSMRLHCCRPGKMLVLTPDHPDYDDNQHLSIKKRGDLVWLIFFFFNICGWVCVCVCVLWPRGRPPNCTNLGPVMHLWNMLYKLRSLEASPCDLRDLKDLLLTSRCQRPQQGSRVSGQHKPEWYECDSHCRCPFKQQQLWQDLFYGSFIFPVHHTRKYMKNSSVSRVQSASKWFKTLCVKGNMQHIPLAVCSSPFPRCTSSLRRLLMDSV